jgi:hypothetical protein
MSRAVLSPPSPNHPPPFTHHLLFGLRQPSFRVCRLYGRATGNLQEDLCQPILMPTQLCRRSSNTHRQVWLSLLWRSLLLSLGPGAHKILFMPSKSLWQVCGLILTWLCPSYHLVVTSSLSLDVGYLFFGGFQHPSVSGCSAASWDFDVLTGGEGCTSFYSAMSWLL